MSFKKISCDELCFNPFTKIGKEWMLITAGNEEKCNTMTASWGGVGVLWNKNVSFTFIRPQRYTLEFVENNEYFSLCFFKEDYKKALTFCGRNSGRDCDKIKEAGLTVNNNNKAPYFNEAKLVLICRKMYVQDLSENCIIDKEIEKNYQDDYHKMFVSEIVEVLEKE